MIENIRNAAREIAALGGVVGIAGIGDKEGDQPRHQPGDGRRGTVGATFQQQGRDPDQEQGIEERVGLGQGQGQGVFILTLGNGPEQEIPHQAPRADGDHAQIQPELDPLGTAFPGAQEVGDANQQGGIKGQVAQVGPGGEGIDAQDHFVMEPPATP